MPYAVVEYFAGDLRNQSDRPTYRNSSYPWKLETRNSKLVVRSRMGLFWKPNPESRLFSIGMASFTLFQIVFGASTRGEARIANAQHIDGFVPGFWLPWRGHP